MQVDELRVEAQRRGWKIVGTYTDEGVSGSRERRPQLDRLLAEVRAGKLDVVAVYAEPATTLNANADDDDLELEPDKE